uniref:Cep57 centrosome localisation domain-containing protein n=1 Tax=Otolemur garnettii TaxID=30611 RepID=H0XRJ9_OTOGA
MNSELVYIIGSYLKPSERVFHHSPRMTCQPVNLDVTSAKVVHSPNSQALLFTLKTAQEKILHLELERTQAEDNLNALSKEAAQYKKALESETNERNLAHEELVKQKKDTSIQLSSAQSRCTLLEKQLEHTRMVLSGEQGKNMILEQQAQLQREKEQDQMKLHVKLEKLDALEECFGLTTQKTAEDKIKHLEEKLKEEEHQHKLFQDKASELQTGLEISSILMPSVSNPKHSKEKKASSKKTQYLKRTLWHIYSKFGALPLVTEKMKQHGGLHSPQKPSEVTEPTCLYKPIGETSQNKAVLLGSESISICDNASELLMAVQDELVPMTMEHQELLKQMKETESYSVCDDVECELE